MANVDRYTAYYTGFEGTGDTFGTQGSRTGAAWYKVRVTQFSDPINRQPAIEETLKLKAAAAIYGGPYKVGGGFEGFFRPKNMTWIMAAMMGYPDGAQDGDDDPYGETIGDTPATDLELILGSTPRAMTLRVGDDQGIATGQTTSTGNVIQYGGVGIKSMEVNLSVGAAATAKFGWIGKHATKIASGTETTFGTVDDSHAQYIDTTEEGTYFYNGLVKINNVDLECKSFTINIDRKFDENYYALGSPYLRDLIMNGLTTVGGTISFGAGQYDAFINTIIGNTTESVLNPFDNPLFSDAAQIELKDTSGSSSTCLFDIAKLKFTEFNRSVQGRNQFEKSLNWQASLGDNEDFKITVKA